MHTTLLLVTSLVEVLHPSPLPRLLTYRNTVNSQLSPASSAISGVDVGMLLNEPQCRVLYSALADCGTRARDFDNMEPLEQAQCLCYDGFNIWKPLVFDEAAKRCASHASMMAPQALYDSLHEVERFCMKAGDVKKQTAAPLTSSGLSWCNTIYEIMRICSTATSGFMDLDKTVQASCLCYTTVATTTSWLPGRFDDAVGSCGLAASNAEKTEIYKAITRLNSFCTGIADDLNALPTLLAGSLVSPSATTAHVSSNLPTSTTSMAFMASTKVVFTTSTAKEIDSSSTRSSKNSTILSLSPTRLSSLLQISSSSIAVPSTTTDVPPTNMTVPPSPGMSESDGQVMSVKRVVAIGGLCALLVLFL